MSNDMFASWVWGISIGAALSGTYLSWRLRISVMTARSAPGTALLISLIQRSQRRRWSVPTSLERLMAYIPKEAASGMIAGILFQFGLHAFRR